LTSSDKHLSPWNFFIYHVFPSHDMLSTLERLRKEPFVSTLKDWSIYRQQLFCFSTVIFSVHSVPFSFIIWISPPFLSITTPNLWWVRIFTTSVFFPFWTPAPAPFPHAPTFFFSPFRTRSPFANGLPLSRTVFLNLELAHPGPILNCCTLTPW